MECTAAGGRAGGRTAAIDAHRQTHQRRFSKRSLDPARQHHDAGTGLGPAAACRPPGGNGAIAVTASGCGVDADTGVGQEAACAEILARTCVSSGRASGAGCCGCERLMLSKAVADR